MTKLLQFSIFCLALVAINAIRFDLSSRQSLIRNEQRHRSRVRGFGLNSNSPHVMRMQQSLKSQVVQQNDFDMLIKYEHQRNHRKKSADDYVSMASIVYKNGKFQIAANIWADDALAYGMLARSLNSTGWDVLDIVTTMDKSFKNDTAVMYAAGLLEGYLTADRIALMYQNSIATEFPTEQSRKVLLPKVRNFLTRQYKWARCFAAENPKSAFHRHTGFVMTQLEGLIDGYLASNDSVVRDPFVLLMLNAAGDLGDIKTALNDTKPDFFDRMSNDEFRNYVQSTGHCSALIRVTPGLERLYMGHSTWSSYSTMLRIYKHYQVNLSDPEAASRGMSFSSYPGCLVSIDDFYILDSGMVMLETTNNVFNVSLFKTVKPESLLSWQRVRIANQIAQNGSHWAWAVSQQNSGTYNNQYMIIDLNRIHPNASIDDGALTVVEQIPTLVVSSDQTGLLRTGYFPSYNVPFHETIYNLSGYPDVVKQRGLDFSYQMAPRAKIFRREAPRVFDAAGMAAVLRFNEFADDPYSEGDACNSICCRRDLRPAGKDAAPSGCLDSKFTDLDMAKYMTSYAISGPTTGSSSRKLPPYAWSQFLNVSHMGLPPVYNFSWVTMSPTVLLG
ncbi:hypothetical protein BOX15_Mlig010955g2 [Macrostomum lignano]|uniref:Phospholipase B-like n=1 Tax=Macrostomum lignano TaxID=282301 RepID=A0A267GM01_9PLAT|nr:hypothetical protein BOX15_Mlig010955g2 [Macrostomum lignano]